MTFIYLSSFLSSSQKQTRKKKKILWFAPKEEPSRTVAVLTFHILWNCGALLEGWGPLVDAQPFLLPSIPLPSWDNRDSMLRCPLVMNRLWASTTWLMQRMNIPKRLSWFWIILDSWITLSQEFNPFPFMDCWMRDLKRVIHTEVDISQKPVWCLSFGVGWSVRSNLILHSIKFYFLKKFFNIKSFFFWEESFWPSYDERYCF